MRNKPSGFKAWFKPIPAWGQAVLGIVLVLLIVETMARALQAYTTLPVSYSKMLDDKYELLMNTPDRGVPILIAVGDSYVYYAFYPELIKARLKQQGVDVDVINLAYQASSIVENSAFMQIAARRFKHPIFFTGVSLLNSNIGSVRDRHTPIGNTVINLNNRPPNYFSRCVVSPVDPPTLTHSVYCGLGQVSAFVRLLPAITDLLFPKPEKIVLNIELKRRTQVSVKQFMHVSSLGGGLQEARHTSHKAVVYHEVEPNYSTPFVDYQNVQVELDWAYSLLKPLRRPDNPPIYLIYFPLLREVFDVYAINTPTETVDTIDKKAQQLAQHRGWQYWDCHDAVRNPTFYKDHVHFNLAGSLYYSQWLATALMPVVTSSSQHDPCQQ